jgi:divalent metal cation (Fe/Co/Zn/Cd) transporter
VADEQSVSPTTTSEEDLQSASQRVVGQRRALNVDSSTTAEEDRHSYGQRRINLIWEITQAIIAVIVTIATLYVAARLALSEQVQSAAFLLLSNAFFLIIGFYFSRSNHNRINDLAPKSPGAIDTR